ncbi:MAG: DUF4215 domain-containing protein [Nannocystaceae bacterium]|nr:DUF4215 domain-containing protein [bacterium]
MRARFVGLVCCVLSGCYVGLPEGGGEAWDGGSTGEASSAGSGGAGSGPSGPGEDPSEGTGAAEATGEETGDGETGGEETGGIPGEDGICGDGVVQPGEECDAGEANADSGSCKPDCTQNVCGDGAVGPGEACDDGNLEAGDRCSPTCALPTCGDGVLDAGEACDDGQDGDDDDGCTDACLLPACGDGIHQPNEGEACDDGNDDDLDGCTNACALPSCGDGLVQAGEDCDDGNGNDGDDCTNACELPIDGGLPDNGYCMPVHDWNESWVDWELEVIALVNQARATPTNCGSEGSFGAADPVVYEPALTCAARVHSKDMGDNGFFSHTNPSGEGPAVRIAAAGYDWSTWGENIAAGQGSPSAVVNGWLDSDGHCANLMNPNFSELGVGYYHAPGSPYTRYWTQNFGAPG